MSYGPGCATGWAGPQILGFQRAQDGPGLQARIKLHFSNNLIIYANCQSSSINSYVSATFYIGMSTKNKS